MFPIALFCAAAGVGLYIAFGYPVLLGLMARMRSKPVVKRRQQKSVSVVIAAYNGGDIYRRQARFPLGPRLSARVGGDSGDLRWIHRRYG